MGFEPLPQQPFELLLEAVRADKTLERCLELSLLRLEPFAPERLQRIELGLSLAAAVGVSGGRCRIRSLAKDIDVRQALALRCTKSSQQFIGCTGGIGPAVRHECKVCRQFGS